MTADERRPPPPGAACALQTASGETVRDTPQFREEAGERADG
jgi:hypothetical protein